MPIQCARNLVIRVYWTTLQPSNPFSAKIDALFITKMAKLDSPFMTKNMRFFLPYLRPELKFDALLI